MLAPSPRVPGIEYRTAYGLTMFDCAPMRASLSPAACSDNYLNRKCLACADCTIGAVHSGKAVAAQPDAAHRSGECVRCLAQTTRRQVGAVLCMSCYNREREILRERNGKGAYPRHIAAHLHRCEATLAGDDLLEKFQLPGQHSQTASPRLSQVAPGTYRLESIVTGLDELSRLLARRVPGATLLEYKIGPSFLERQQVVTPL